MSSNSNYSLLKIVKWFILKEKSIYKELNKLKDGDRMLFGLFWCPAKMRD
jgi:hypothetical protein